jgi:hypothetical protein
VLSAGIGLGIQGSIDPSLPTRPVADAFSQVMNLLAALGAAQN